MVESWVTEWKFSLALFENTLKAYLHSSISGLPVALQANVTWSNSFMFSVGVATIVTDGASAKSSQILQHSLIDSSYALVRSP